MVESGVLPGVNSYPSRWYPRADVTDLRRRLLLRATPPMAEALGSVLAIGILKIPNLGGLQSGWRMMFVVEGALSAVLGVVGLFLLTDRPRTACWSMPEEQQHLMECRAPLTLDEVDGLDTMLHVRWRRFRRGCVLCSGILFFLGSFTFQGLEYLFPSIVATIFPETPTRTQQLSKAISIILLSLPGRMPLP